MSPMTQFWLVVFWGHVTRCDDRVVQIINNWMKLTPRLLIASRSKPTTLFPSAPEALKPLVQLSRIPCEQRDKHLMNQSEPLQIQPSVNRPYGRCCALQSEVFVPCRCPRVVLERRKWNPEEAFCAWCGVCPGSRTYIRLYSQTAVKRTQKLCGHSEIWVSFKVKIFFQKNLKMFNYSYDLFCFIFFLLRFTDHFCRPGHGIFRDGIHLVLGLHLPSPLLILTHDDQHDTEVCSSQVQCQEITNL